MAIVVYGLLEDAAASQSVVADLTARTAEHPSFMVHVHHGGPLDGDDLPEAATETGRNTVVGTVVGAASGAVFGFGAASMFDLAGVTAGTGAGLGLLFGLLVGLMNGMMAFVFGEPAARRHDGLAHGVRVFVLHGSGVRG